MRFRALLFAVLQTAALSAFGQTLTVRILAQESIPPKWIAGPGQATGVCPDLLAALSKIEPQLQFTGMNETRSLPVMERQMATGHVDTMCALLDTPTRRRLAHPVETPVYVVRHRIAARVDDDADIKSYEELARLKPLINTTRGAGYVEQLRGLGLNVDDTSGDNLVNLRKVVAGHGRFMLLNELTFGYLTTDTDLAGKVKLLPAVLKEEPVYFWVSKSADPRALPLLTAAMQQLKRNGELARIYAHWSHINPGSATSGH